MTLTKDLRCHSCKNRVRVTYGFKNPLIFISGVVNVVCKKSKGHPIRRMWVEDFDNCYNYEEKEARR